MGKRGNKKMKRQSERRRSPSSSPSSSSESSSDSSATSRENSRKEIKRLRRRLSTLEWSSQQQRLQYQQPAMGDELVIPEFDPQRSELLVEAWTARVDNLAKSYGWTDAAIVRLVSSRLKGMARRWYDSQDLLSTDWAAMRQSLTRQFRKPLPFSKLLWNAATYCTHPGQDLSVYCYNKLAKLKLLQVNIPEVYLVDAIIGGITDESIVNIAKSARYQNTDDLFAYLSTLGRVSATGVPANRQQSTSACNSKENSPNALSSTHRPLRQHNIKAVPYVPRNLRCFNCKGNHYAEDCKHKNTNNDCRQQNSLEQNRHDVNKQ